MSPLPTDKLKVIRKYLDKSQRELADQLGISLRAIQSYEQGWRSMPPSLQKLLLQLLYLHWRRENIHPAPCWETKKCGKRKRLNCLAWKTCSGDCCWLTTGNQIECKPQASWEKKLAHCIQCPVMSQWLDPVLAVAIA